MNDLKSDSNEVKTLKILSVIFLFVIFKVYLFQVITDLFSLREKLTRRNNIRVHMACNVNTLPEKASEIWETEFIPNSCPYKTQLQCVLPEDTLFKFRLYHHLSMLIPMYPLFLFQVGECAKYVRVLTRKCWK